MKRVRILLVCVAVLWIVGVPANSCGPFFDEAEFATKSVPQALREGYLKGHLGVVQGTYYPRYLMAAYLWLQGRGLSADEQAQIAPKDDGRDGAQTAEPESSQHWLEAQKASLRKVAGSNWQSYDNCLSDAFAQAEQTLADRVKRYGAQDPEVMDWQSGQAAVFQNCGEGSVMPAAAPEKASLWLRQDRAYQIAAAQFYSADFVKARESFDAIGSDEASPWHLMARYLAVRAMVRDATLVAEEKPLNKGLMIEAEGRLRTLLKDPEMKPLQGTLESYLGYVAIRAHPEARASELAELLSGAKSDKHFGQDLTDLLYYFDHADANEKLPASSEMVDWVRTVHAADGAHAMERWRAMHSRAWLVAAMTLAGNVAGAKKEPGDTTANVELAAAARAISPNAPGYAAVTYHRLRLLSEGGVNPAADERAELNRLLPQIEKTETLSTVNLFLQLRAATAPKLDDFLKDAARTPAADFLDSAETADTPVMNPQKLVVCTKEITDSGERAAAGRRFDMDGAIVLNQRLPVEAMAEAGNSTALPQPLRFETALAAWSRAVLLDQPQVAAKLSAGLAGCQPGMKTWLDKYDQSTTAEERHVNGLFALMRFPSVRPYVNEGFARGGDFAAYDVYRDNWWCGDLGTSMASNNLNNSYSYDGQKVPGLTLASTGEFPDPAFVGKNESAQAVKELELLAKLGTAPDYFADQALAWVDAYPTDTRNADLLGFAKRVMRNGCRSKGSSEWDHKLFLKMQKKYPESSWAKKYSTWE